MKTNQKFFAELIGTFILVLGGCGTAIFAGEYVGFLGVSLAFGLTIVAAAYGIGHISGAHLNPAVSLGAWACGRLPAKDLFPYISAQLCGAIIAASVLVLIKGYCNVGDFAANGYGEAGSPGGYGIVAALTAEVVLTFVFLLVILGATDKRAPAGFAGLSIGLTLTLIHLISIPITNTSVNPARSISQAIFADNSWALPQLWLFIVAPIVGAILAGLLYKKVFSSE